MFILFVFYQVPEQAKGSRRKNTAKIRYQGKTIIFLFSTKYLVVFKDMVCFQKKETKLTL